LLLSALLLLGIAAIGTVDVLIERYFTQAINAHSAAFSFGNESLIDATRKALQGDIGEVKREAPWTLYIVHYMYMIYVGSGIVFIVAVAELIGIETIKKTAAGFLTLGLGMIVAGLFTILMDLNIPKLYHMFLSPQYRSGMWLMLPLYALYIPMIVLEIYLILVHRTHWIKRVAWVILLLSLALEFVEFYIQAKLFNMNSARHLWTSYPLLPLYFMISSFVASFALMILYTYLSYSTRNNPLCKALTGKLQRWTLYTVMLLAVYEATAYLFIDPKWARIILFGPFRFLFFAYLIFAIGIPFMLLLKDFKNHTVKVIAALSLIFGTYLGKIIFVYGGNAYPMSDRFGVGFEKYGEYEATKTFIFFFPPWSEIAVTVGSWGIVLMLFWVADRLWNITQIDNE